MEEWEGIPSPSACKNVHPLEGTHYAIKIGGPILKTNAQPAQEAAHTLCLQLGLSSGHEPLHHWPLC